jgi:CubicO group peptidase (beta-lactamase class C family)
MSRLKIIHYGRPLLREKAHDLKGVGRGGGGGIDAASHPRGPGQRVFRRTALTVAALLAALAWPGMLAQPSVAAESTETLARLKEEARQFQGQEMITARAFSFVFNPGDRPRITWRDTETVRDLGCTQPLRVRWFDDRLDEATTPSRPGRWGAVIEGTAPNGTPLRRSMTFYCRPPGMFLVGAPTIDLAFEYQPGPIGKTVWREHKDEIRRCVGDAVFRSLNDSETGAILLSGLAAIEPKGRPPKSWETAQAANEDYHLALKLKVTGVEGATRTLAPMRRRARPAPALHKGTMREAGMKPGAKRRIGEVCRAWAKDSGTPFVTLVARNGVIVTHGAFGLDETSAPVTRDFRAGIASITKSISAMLFMRFVDQGLLRLDDPVSVAFPDWPTTGPTVPTFRQCLTHMSGVTGHGSHGGVRNPNLENIILNGIHAMRPGREYNYSGVNFDLAGKAMEMVAGKTARRLLQEDLYGPLGIGDVPMGDMGAGAAPTARELAILAQVLANRGSYGDLEVFSESAFSQMLPADLSAQYPGVGPREEYGPGIGRRYDVREGAETTSTRPQDLYFSANTLGHGSLSQCIFRADLEHNLVVVQIRRTGGPRYPQWVHRFFAAISDSMMEQGH